LAAPAENLARTSARCGPCSGPVKRHMVLSLHASLCGLAWLLPTFLRLINVV
jgi:hypothetical protein